MNKNLTGLIIGTVLLVVAATSNATLIDLLDGVVQDDRGTVANEADDLFWVQDFNVFNEMNYDEQIAAIEDYSNESTSNQYDDAGWHMASSGELGQLFDDYTFTELMGPFVHIDGAEPTTGYQWNVWGGRIEDIDTAGNRDYVAFYMVDTGVGYTGPFNDDSPISDGMTYWSIGSWVVTNATPVPEPSVTILLGTCLAVFAGLRLRRKKK